MMQHGTRGNYTAGCRCTECKRANAEYQRGYMREWKARKRGAYQHRTCRVCALPFARPIQRGQPPKTCPYCREHRAREARLAAAVENLSRRKEVAA